jgi:aspartyl protease family protein
LRTANGNSTGRIIVIPELKVGNAVARNIEAVVAPGLGETNVLGMNFLTKLKGWRVEDRVMVLEPHHPTNEDADTDSAN